MFKIKQTKGIYDKVSGIFMQPIQYEVRVPDGDWSPWFGVYQNQKWGQWDSNSCWAVSGINSAEDQCEYLHKAGKFSQEAKDFFMRYGYIDEDGDFSFSERFLEVLSGVHDNGNNQMEAWILMQKYGMIPRSMLTYTKERADAFNTKPDFNADYFNSDAITDEMMDLGQQFLKYVNISRQWIGKNWYTPDINLLKAALKQAPLHIGIPVPNAIYKWNAPFVQYDGKKEANHAVELYKINDDGTYCIFDQYQPCIKTLSSDYILPLVCQGILMATPVRISHPTGFWGVFWSRVNNYFNDIPVPNDTVGDVA